MPELPTNIRPATLAEAWAVIDQLMRVVTALQARVAELEARLGQNSQNSSRPPSSDSPAVNRMKERAPSGRKPGGQPGHEGHQRMMVPEDQVDDVVAVKPKRCRRCHERLHGADAQPQRHQVIELPEQRPQVTEYRLHTLQCASCGLTTTAPLPAEVPRGMFGPRLQATIAVCTGVYHLSRRTTVQLLADLFHVELALGSISATERAVSDAVAGPVQEARRYVQEQAVVHADETGWRQARQRAWLWVMFSALVTVFVVQGRRGSEAARALLGTCSAILVTDRYGAYRQWAVEGRQLCWAHLLRDFTAFTERGGEAARLGRAFLQDARLMFSRWHRVRDGSLSHRRFWQEMHPVRQRVEARLRRGSECSEPKTAATCRDLLAMAPALWTFIEIPGVEPTNNAAERALRPAVLWRKRSFGTHSAQGSRFAERMLTVSTTLRQQRRNVLDYLSQVTHASLQNRPAPSLLPAVP